MTSRASRRLLGRREDETGDIVFALGAAGTYLHGRDRFLAACPPFLRTSASERRIRRADRRRGRWALLAFSSSAPASLVIVSIQMVYRSNATRGDG